MSLLKTHARNQGGFEGFGRTTFENDPPIKSEPSPFVFDSQTYPTAIYPATLKTVVTVCKSRDVNRTKGSTTNAFMPLPQTPPLHPQQCPSSNITATGFEV